MTKYFTNFFHALIVASFILSFSGCGWKGDPIYVSPEQKIKNEKKLEQQQEKARQQDQKQEATQE